MWQIFVLTQQGQWKQRRLPVSLARIRKRKGQQERGRERDQYKDRNATVQHEIIGRERGGIKRKKTIGE